MGGTSSSSSQQTQSLAPYTPAQGTVNGILGQIGNIAPSAGTLNPIQTQAINQITNTANGTPSYTAPIQAGTMGLLNGGNATQYNPQITGALNTYTGNTSALANNTDYNPYDTPGFSDAIKTASSDITNNINSQWAAAGRDGSPGNAQALSRGLAQGLAPTIAAQYNTNVGNQQGAAQSLLNNTNATYGILNGNNATSNANFVNGVGTVGAGIGAETAAPSAALQAQSMAFGIPVSQLMTLLGGVSPVAAQFGTQTGTSNGTQTMSGAQQFGLIANGIGSMMPKGPVNFSF